MKISFATTCMNRLHHLRETLPQNIEDNPSTRSVRVEFAVVNYGSRDGMDEWMKSDAFMRKKIEDGTVRYARCEGVEKFHMAHAKNVAHLLSTGDVVCNVDADNFTGDGFAAFLAHEFRRAPDIIVMPAYRCSAHLPSEDRGFYGRLAVSAANFARLGGYDETLQGWGGDDSDFRRRAKGLGLHQLQFDDGNFLRAISHSNADRVVNMDNPQGFDAAVAKISRTGRGDSPQGKIAAIYNALTKPVTANPQGFGGAQVREGLEGRRISLGTPTPKDRPAERAPSTCLAGLPEMVMGRVFPRLA